MKIGTQIEMQIRWFGEKGSLAHAAQAGFDAIDLSLHPQTDMYTCPLATAPLDQLVEHYADLRKYAKGLGLTFSQVHTPLAHARREEETEYNEVMYRMQCNSIACCAALGAEYAVIHVQPDAQPGQRRQADADRQHHRPVLPPRHIRRHGRRRVLHGLLHGSLPGAPATGRPACADPSDS